MARYTDDFRASAVVMLEAAGYAPGKNGGALASVARRLKVPHSTLQRWYNATKNPPPPDLAGQTKVDLAALLEAEVIAAVGEMDHARVDADYRALATAVGIFMDKLNNLRGEVESRHEIIIKYDELNFNPAETT